MVRAGLALVCPPHRGAGQAGGAGRGAQSGTATTERPRCFRTKVELLNAHQENEQALFREALIRGE